MNSPVQQIKERLSIEEVVSSYIKLEKAGTNLKAKCPFHNEKTPSFFISPDRGTYYCFGCGVKGDIFTFVEEFEGLDFRGALKLLAGRAGIVLESYDPKDKKNQSEKERLYQIIEEATLFFEKNLKENPEALSYLKDRGLNDESIKNFRIGFVKNDWRELYSHLTRKGFGDVELEKAGLIKKTEKGYYDRFRGRIMFPMSDSSGRVIAFSGRIFVDDLSAQAGGKSAKYLNSPETPIFNKSSILYGLDKAKQSIRKNDFSIVVEGQFDLILSHQAGFRNTVATSGTALVDQEKSKDNVINNLGVVSRLSQNIVFIFDSDKAGFNASIRATPIAMALFSDMNVKASSVPGGMDPADLIKNKGVDAWREVIKNSKHIIEFLIDKYMSDDSRDKLKIKLEIDGKIIPYIALINNPIKKSHFITLVSNKTGISESDIREKLEKVEFELKHEKEDIKIAIENEEKKLRKDPIERRLLGIAFWQDSIKDKKIDPELIFRKLASPIGSGSKEDILEKYKDRREDLIYEVEEFYSNNENLDKDVNEMLLNLEEEYLNEELTKQMMELQNLKGKEDEIEIFKKINEINKRKEDIKNGRK